jgi:hypothetical protein
VNVFVMGRGMMFSKVVSKIVGAFAPMYNELALFDAIAYQIETYVDGL